MSAPTGSGKTLAAFLIYLDRLVAGFVGEQFARPEAVDLLRRVRRDEGAVAPIVVPAADPLNLMGIVSPCCCPETRRRLNTIPEWHEEFGPLTRSAPNRGAPRTPREEAA